MDEEGIYLCCDPKAGWSVVIRDSAGSIVRAIVEPVSTMEEAMRRFAGRAGNPVFLKLLDPDLRSGKPVQPLHSIRGMSKDD